MFNCFSKLFRFMILVFIIILFQFLSFVIFLYIHRDTVEFQSMTFEIVQSLELYWTFCAWISIRLTVISQAVKFHKIESFKTAIAEVARESELKKKWDKRYRKLNEFYLSDMSCDVFMCILSRYWSGYRRLQILQTNFLSWAAVCVVAMCDRRWLVVLKEMLHRSQVNGRLELSWWSFKWLSSLPWEMNRKPHWEHTNRQLCIFACVFGQSTSFLHSKQVFSTFSMTWLCMVAICSAADTFEKNGLSQWKHGYRYVRLFSCKMPVHRATWFCKTFPPRLKSKWHFGHS